MKILSLCFLVVLIATSCSKEALAPTTVLNQIIADTSAVLKFNGTFVNGPYGTTSGKAEIYLTKNNTYELKLSNFSVSNGPSLFVLLSKEVMPVNFINLGALQSTMGNQVYSIASNPDFKTYKYISIHCTAYNHLFGSSLIQ